MAGNTRFDRRLQNDNRGNQTIKALTDTIKKHPWYASILLATVVYGLLGFFLAPYVLEKTLVKTMKQDFDAGLRIEKIEINPFVLSLRVNGLALDNPAGRPTVRVQSAFANFQLSSIFNRALTFEAVLLSSPELFLARNVSGDMNFAYLMKPAGKATDDNAAGGKEDPALIQALVHNFKIEDFFINWSDQVPADPVETRVGPITIDIEEFNTLPGRSAQQSVVIATQNTGTLSWTGDLQLNPFRTSGQAKLKGLHFPLVSAYIRHQAGIDIVDGRTDVELNYEVYASDTGQLQASIDNLDLSLADITVNSFADGSGFDFAGEDQQILMLPRARLANGRFEWPQRTLSLGSISIDNLQLDLSRDNNGLFNLEPRQAGTTGEIAQTSANEDDQDSFINQWQLAIGNLDINGLALKFLDHSVTPAAALGVTDVNLKISDISNIPGKRFPTELNLQVSTGGRISLAGEVSIWPEPLFDFDVDIDALQLAAAQPYIRQQANLNTNSGAVNLKGHVNGSAKEPLLLNGDLEIVDLAIAESMNNERLLSWKSLAADKIALSIARRELDISRLRFDQVYGDIQINKDGSLNIGQVKKVDTVSAQTEPPVKPATETAPVPADSRYKIRIGDIAMTNASADFIDLSLPLPFAVKIDRLNGKMTTVSTESNAPSEVSLEGKVDEFGLARISGIVSPLKPSDNTDLAISFENIAVPKFTPYSIAFAGREIANGTLDLKLGYQLQNGLLVGENSIVLRDFELGKEIPHPGALDLPLGLAVALLKDRNGKIDIELPVSGNIDNPDFDYGGVIRAALRKLLVKIVVAPFSALASLLGIEANKLEQVNFLAGRSDLTPPEMQEAENLAKALALRPKLRLVIAGVFDPTADGAALRTLRFNTILEQRITDIGAGSDQSLQYADLRRVALEQMFSERTTAGGAIPTLDELRVQFTTLVEVEGQAEPVPTLDKLAYANALRRQLIDLQPLDDNALVDLASARAAALKAALLGIDGSLQDRVSIADNEQVMQEQGESIKMKITLTGPGS